MKPKAFQIICNAKVSGLIADNQMIKCVELESGKKILADAVLAGYWSYSKHTTC